MDYRTFVAWQVWTIDTDQLHLSPEVAWEKFNHDAVGIKKNFTDPEDVLLYIEKAVTMTPLEVIVDYALCMAKCRIISETAQNRESYYGKLTDTILKVA